jgi:hypothetical protein
MGGGYHAKINDMYVGLTTRKAATSFKTLPTAKKAVEAEIIKLIRRAYKQLEIED